jgi:putative tricarboxylic transport membrane protein
VEETAMIRRSVLAGATIIFSIIVLGPAWAQYKPTRPIEFVVHGGPGSGNDAFARAMISLIEKEKLSPVRIQIANRTGGGGTTAMTYIVGKKGDANVIALFTGLWLTNPLVQAEATARLHDMTPIARLIHEPALLVVKADSPHKTLKEWVEAAKKNPGQMKQAGGSPMARDNLIRNLLMTHSGANWSYISFPGGGERVAAVLGGHVDMMMLEPSEAGELLRGGKLRALAQIAERRIVGYENIPTVKEAGFDVPNVPQARGVVGPPEMSADVLAFYEDLMQRLVQSESWKKYLAETQLEGAFLKSKETGQFFVEYEKQLRGILQAAGIRLVR